ncbi:MAG: hypothetical protein ACLFPE_07945 [Bacteroidales bacterium]
MKLQSLILALMLLMFFGTGFAQDKIYKRNQDVIECKIREVGSDEIKYQLPDYPQDVLFSLEKDKIIKVVFENGKELDFIEEMQNPENYVGQSKNAIKIEFLSPLTGNTTFAYERSLKPGKSLEATLGIIGLGVNTYGSDTWGSFLKFGMKFIKSPDFYLKGMRYAHILKGSYVKPEIAFGYYNKTVEEWSEYGSFYNQQHVDVYSMTIQLVIGKQWVMKDAFLVDFFGGVGYGFDNQGGDYHFGYAIASDDVPLSFSAGLKIGYLF